MKRVMFVCTGNICRSPLAEGILRSLANDAGLNIEVASSGLQSYHAGEAPDYRAIEVARENGIDIKLLRAKQFEESDFEKYDYIFAMAPDHLRLLLKYCPQEQKEKVHLLLAFTKTQNIWNDTVQDPYYGTLQDFQNVYSHIHKACETLLSFLK